MTRPTAYALIVFASVSWGLSMAFTKFGLGQVPPMLLMTIEITAATATLWAATLVRRRPLRVVHRHALALGSLEPALSFILITLGLQYTTAANGSLITGLEACFVVVLAAVLLRERLTVLRVIAVGLSLVGMFVLTFAGEVSGFSVGDVLVVLGVLAAALYVIVAKKTVAGKDALVLTTFQFTYALVITLVATGFAYATGLERLDHAINPVFVVVVILTGIVCIALSYLAYNIALPHTSAGAAANIVNLVPVFGVLGAVVFLHETLPVTALLGAALIVAAIVIFTHSDRRQERLGHPATIAPVPMLMPDTEQN